jgi:hypothetical protein
MLNIRHTRKGREFFLDNTTPLSNLVIGIR